MSIAVLLLSIAAPLRAHEVFVVTDGAASCGALAKTARGETFGAERSSETGTGMRETSYLGRPCAAGNLEMAETAEFSDAGWSADRFEATPDIAEMRGASPTPVSSEQAASYAAELSAAHPEDPPAGTKVPEPATLVLLGTGLIATSSLSRTKRQPKNALGLAVARLGPFPQHPTAAV